MTDWKHDDLMGDLASHLCAPDRLVWQDLQIGPSGSPRPDVFTLQKSYARPQPSAYECKISVSDFRSDITSGKWHSYLEFSGSVTFCIPAGLVKKDDIPNGCGLMMRGPEGWHTHRKATRQAVRFNHDHLMKLLIDGYGRELGQIELRRREMRQALAADKLCKKFGRDVAEVIRDLGNAKRMVQYYTEQGESKREKAREDVKQIIESQQEEWKNLATVLGLPEKSGQWEIKRAIMALARPDHSNQVATLKRGIADIERIARGMASA